jgi:glycine/D-amino acid oxidase-like deaminating enzyme
VEHQDFDVIVVGGGGAGLAAAIEAKNAGASVLICEAGSQFGGSTGVAGGLFLAADTGLQKAQGVTDTADDFYDYIMMMNRWELEAAVARRYAEESGPTIAWMQDLGIEFEPYVHPVALSAVPRGHLPKDYGIRHHQGDVQCYQLDTARRGLVNVQYATYIRSSGLHREIDRPPRSGSWPRLRDRRA